MSRMNVCLVVCVLAVLLPVLSAQAGTYTLDYTNLGSRNGFDSPQWFDLGTPLSDITSVTVNFTGVSYQNPIGHPWLWCYLWGYRPDGGMTTIQGLYQYQPWGSFQHSVVFTQGLSIIQGGVLGVSIGGGYFDYQSLSITSGQVIVDATAVPEPASMLTLIAGIGAVGGLVFRRKR